MTSLLTKLRLVHPPDNCPGPSERFVGGFVLNLVSDELKGVGAVVVVVVVVDVVVVVVAVVVVVVR